MRRSRLWMLVSRLWTFSISRCSGLSTLENIAKRRTDSSCAQICQKLMPDPFDECLARLQKTGKKWGELRLVGTMNKNRGTHRLADVHSIAPPQKVFACAMQGAWVVCSCSLYMKRHAHANSPNEANLSKIVAERLKIAHIYIGDHTLDGWIPEIDRCFSRSGFRLIPIHWPKTGISLNRITSSLSAHGTTLLLFDNDAESCPRRL